MSVIDGLEKIQSLISSLQNLEGIQRQLEQIELIVTARSSILQEREELKNKLSKLMGGGNK